jgi:radical SAM superfamily enzyme YgiQ (UPF0313 family)
MAFCFPDTYEIGMSNLGMRILYDTINAMDGVWCERGFAPGDDMARELRAAGMPLYALESGDPLGAFDAIGFSLGYEMAYTTVLDMLDLGGIPLRSAARPDLLPLVFAGGSSCCNIEPMADFLDLAILGEGEVVDNEVLELLRRAKREGWDKPRFLRAAADIPGVYVPCLYDAAYSADGTVAAVTPRDGAPAAITKRIVADLDRSPFPTRQIVPGTEIVHDRVNLELFRGCIRGCRFCQAGQIYRPVRSRGSGTLLAQGVAALEHSGYQEITLSSLSSSDYRGLGDLCDGLLDYCVPRSIGLALPSLRADNFSMELMQRVQKVRKAGLTFAPEAGTQRLRDVINKNVREEDLLESCRVAFAGGWNNVKLYFMLGLPTETDEDVIGIARMHPTSCTLAGARGEQGPRRAHHGLDLLLIPNRTRPSSGRRWSAGGVPPAREAAARAHQRQSRRLQLARREDQRDRVHLSRGDRGWARSSSPSGAPAAGSRPGATSSAMNAGRRPSRKRARRELLHDGPRTADEVMPWDHIDIGRHEAASAPGVRAGGKGRPQSGLPRRLRRLRRGKADGREMRWISCAALCQGGQGGLSLAPRPDAHEAARLSARGLPPEVQRGLSTPTRSISSLLPLSVAAPALRAHGLLPDGGRRPRALPRV